MEPSFSPLDRVQIAPESANVRLLQGGLLLRAGISHAERIGGAHNARSRQAVSKARALADLIASPSIKGQLVEQMLDYWADARQRMTLTIDPLRERANNDAAHEAAGTPPILIYERSKRWSRTPSRRCSGSDARWACRHARCARPRPIPSLPKRLRFRAFSSEADTGSR